MDEKFELVSKYSPTGDQPEAIEKLVEGLNDGLRYQTLLGVTGSGKTFTMANIIKNTNRPTLVIAHNKTRIDDLTTDVTTVENNIETLNGKINLVSDKTNTLETSISNEVDARILKDNDLQKQIQALEAKSSVVDIVATEKDIAKYDTSKLRVDDVICVLRDSIHNDTVSYYRWIQKADLTKDFQYIGSEGAYYTKAESDVKFISSDIKINGHPVSSDINLTAQDVSALPASTVIGDGTITIQKLDLQHCYTSHKVQ